MRRVKQVKKVRASQPGRAAQVSVTESLQRLGMTVLEAREAQRKGRVLIRLPTNAHFIDDETDLYILDFVEDDDLNDPLIDRGYLVDLE